LDRLVADFAGRGSEQNFFFFTNKGHDDRNAGL
jgi:hypothetical protein